MVPLFAHLIGSCVPCPPLKPPPPNVVTVPPKGEGDGHEVTPPPPRGGIAPHNGRTKTAAVTVEPQEKFSSAPVCPIWPSDGPPPPGGWGVKGGGGGSIPPRQPSPCPPGHRVPSNDTGPDRVNGNQCPELMPWGPGRVQPPPRIGGNCLVNRGNDRGAQMGDNRLSSRGCRRSSVSWTV